MEKISEKEYSYQEAISILTSQAKFHISLGLDRIGKLLELFGNPQDNLKVIHVAGTNGKGSTCAMLSSILKEAGYKTGLYTSPHLVEYTERIKINNSDIPEKDFARLIFNVLDTAENNNIPVTEFEILTALAFIYFNEQNVDLVVLETGLGGRLDATNIVKEPLFSIITTIDLDHTDRLGNTIEQIAFEKAGIIKENIPIITLKDNNGLNVIQNIARQKSSLLVMADSSSLSLSQDGKVCTPTQEYELPLLGLWQINNLALVLEATTLLNKLGIFIDETAIKSGLRKVNWQARFQYIKENNLIIDGAHNPSAAKLLIESLNFYFPDKKRIWVYSSINTKDYESITDILFREEDIIILTSSASKSAVEPEIIKETILLKKPSQNIYITPDVTESINLIPSIMSNEFLTIVAGSLYTAGELLSILGIK